jgi:hypothetical protein
VAARFLDGPAQGVTIGIRTCPTWLRVVQSPSGFDALNFADDTPNGDEWIHVYTIVPGTWSQVFVRPGGEYQSGDYRHVEVPEERRELLRELVPWRAFAALSHFGLVESQLEVPAALAAELGRITEEQFTEGAATIGAREVSPGVWTLG